jgi:hypothetical protein
MIEPGQHVRFRYRVIIHPGLEPARLAELYQNYAKAKSATAASAKEKP